MQKEPITQKGLFLLKKKLHVLKSVIKPKVINAVKKARSFGDLKENAEYHASKEELIIVEKKIRELERLILIADVIDTKSVADLLIIQFGAVVKLRNLETHELLSYYIVGEYESSLSRGKISIRSPLANIMILKMKTDIISVRIGLNPAKYKILNIVYI